MPKRGCVKIDAAITTRYNQALTIYDKCRRHTSRTKLPRRFHLGICERRNRKAIFGHIPLHSRHAFAIN